ncbi:MAG: DUF1553 domain-containing protein [Acidobacteria bacterium]|nr:DUF1553 domain-containing protein [Acidobacteriota bacterium]
MSRLCTLFLAATLLAAPKPQRIAIEPHNPLLFGKGARQALAVIAHFADGTQREVTQQCQFSSGSARATVDATGVITAQASGGAVIKAACTGLQATTTALIQRAEAPTPASFNADVMPVLTKLGCNGGNCHGALNGQNGFKLSLFGYEPDQDYDMIVRKHDGRRVNLQAPEQSLLLQKPAFEVQHGGGKLLRKDSDDYQALLNWIRDGARLVPANERRITGLRLTPASAVLTGKDGSRRLLVTARLSDGAERDVTRLVKFQSNDDSIAKVSADGVVTAGRGGETAIVVRAPGIAAAAKVGVVLTPYPVTDVVSNNFIDDHVFAKLKALHIPPSPLCDDATFLRRASLDIIGLIPTVEETRAFLAGRDPGKRAKLVDSLLERPEYADFWSLYWGDHLNNTKQLLYNKGPYVFTRWLHDAFRKNLPYDQFARELLTSSGPMFGAGASNYYPLMKKEPDLAAITSQLFLGVSIECARCHNHPLEKWTQSDFSGMAAFFSQVRYKSGTGPRNNERVLYVDFKRQYQHPDSKQVYLPKPLAGPVLEPSEDTDRRELLADWLTSPRNPFFAKAIVNRMWRNFMGRGLVEPVDDFRDTNPSTNDPLLDALAQDFIAHRYDLHHLIRTITASRAYQLSSVPTEANRDDKMAFSRYYPRRLTAEQLLDSISLATGVEERYTSLYPGTRAAQLPEPEIESYFLEVFDRPSRQLICERKQPPTLNQALHLISGDTIHKKVTSPKGALARMQERPAEEVIEDLYLRTLARFPDAEERKAALAAAAKSPQRGLEDVFWALLNSKEFLYNH